MKKNDYVVEWFLLLSFVYCQCVDLVVERSDQMGSGLRFLPLGPFFIPVTTVLFEVLVSALLSS